MQKWCKRSLAVLLMFSLILPILVGCGTSEQVADKVKEEYPLESVNGSGKQSSYVYRAANQSVQAVAASLSAEREPEQTSKPSDERMFLVYPNEVIHIQKDPKNADDSLVEVDSKEYVQNNYSPGFLEGYLLSSLVNKWFEGKRGGNYQGYATKDSYKPQGEYHKPSSDEKKMHPPLTADRIGSITRRSKDFDSRSRIKNDSYNTRNNRDSYTRSRTDYSNWRSSGPSTRSGSGRISRRR